MKLKGGMTPAIVQHYRALSESMPLPQSHESLEETFHLYDGGSDSQTHLVRSSFVEALGSSVETARLF
jgi:hypothetical protein